MKKTNEKLEKELEAFTIDYPDEEEIDQTIFALYEYVPERENRWKKAVTNSKKKLVLTGRDLVHISSLFWISNLIFLMLGILSLYLTDANPYAMLFMMAPLPFLTGLRQIFKSRDQGMAELEATFRYSVHQVIFSRILVVAAFNLLLNAIFISFLSLKVDIQSPMSELLIYWMMPLCVFAGLGLFITSIYRGFASFALLITCWLVTGYSVSLLPQRITLVNGLGIGISLVITFASLLLFVLLTRKIKRGDLLEFGS